MINQMAAKTSKFLVPLAVRMAKVTYPTGNPKFSVMQAFPASITAEEADPFLMMDHFGPTLSDGKISDPDSFQVDWHPHRGMDILTYITEGLGRHADSLGNRGEYASPGMQWISVGSGVEHAEGGGTPAGDNTTGFQIWVNVPSDRKMDDPRYGTEPPENIPLLKFPGVQARLLAGSMAESTGPFKTVQPVQMVDYELQPNQSIIHTLPSDMDNCIVYVHKGAGTVAGAQVSKNSVVRLGAEDPSVRDMQLCSGEQGMSVLVFAGKRLKQTIAWHGPFVMTTNAEIQKTIDDYRRGKFPPVRAPWDYKKLADFPKSQ